MELFGYYIFQGHGNDWKLNKNFIVFLMEICFFDLFKIYFFF